MKQEKEFLYPQPAQIVEDPAPLKKIMQGIASSTKETRMCISVICFSIDLELYIFGLSTILHFSLPDQY